MTEGNSDDVQRGDGPDPEAEQALLKFLAQFGITPGPDGRLDLEKLMGQMEGAMRAFATQMAGYGPADADSGVNWAFAQDIARRATRAAGEDPAPNSAQRAAIRDAAGLADLWLDEETAFPRITPPPTAWSRAEWLDHTYPAWQQLVRPVVNHLAAALGGLLGGRLGMERESAALQPMVRMAASGMFAAQVGQSLARLATDVLSAGDVGLPLTEHPRVAMLPTNIAAFGDGLDVDTADVLLFLTLRESARQRLFAAVPWLGPQLLALVEHYARDISIDGDALERAVESHLSGAMSPEELERAGQALAGSLFAPSVTAEQREVLGRLETMLALVEGWVDDVVGRAVAQRMPAAAALTETLRRRRATGGPAEAALRALVGLELRPRRTRDAANLWAATRSARGQDARDETWDHPDLMPSTADLDDPLGFAEAGHSLTGTDAMDAELARLLEEESD